MRGIVADEFESLVALAGDDRQLGIAVDRERGVDQLAVDLARQCGLGQARADIGGDLGDGYGIVIAPVGAIGKGYDRHAAVSPCQW